MTDIRIIKRYPNRRLYDTVKSGYITLDEVQDLVLQQLKFKIVDQRTNEDLTNYVLLQIISEQEHGKLPIFTTEILENMIRFYGNPLQKTMSQFLEKSFAAMSASQGNVPDYVEALRLDNMVNLTKQNIDLWQSLFTQYFTQGNKENFADKTKRKANKPIVKPIKPA